MPTSDLLSILLAHDQWATLQILDVCAKLTDEQFHRRFDMGPGSLHDTLRHMLGAMQTWIDTLKAQPLRPRLDQGSQRRTPVELSELTRQINGELATEARRLPPSEVATREREGNAYRYTRATILAHVTTHGMHHRAQCLNMLKQLGVKPLPPSSVAEWSRQFA